MMAALRRNRADADDLSGNPLLDAPVPAFAAPSPRELQVTRIAPNPENRRDMVADSAKVRELAEDMQERGQLQPSTVVTRKAFLDIYPEHETAIGDATHVQVMGGRRLAAAKLLGWAMLDITVKDNLATSRAEFLGATAAENIQREDFNPIEEARQVEALVAECGSGKAAAARLVKVEGWVTQRLNLLKLIPDVQAVLKTGTLPVSRVRKWHKLTPDEQRAALTEWQAGSKANDAAGGRPPAKPKPNKPSQPEHPVNQVRVQLWGAAEVCGEVVEALRGSMKVIDVSDWRPGGASASDVPLGRVHVVAAVTEVGGADPRGDAEIGAGQSPSPDMVTSP
jgi:ParB family chromosome partitioning protein